MLNALAIAAVFVSLTACEDKSYTISGTAEGFNNGDTLYVTNDLDTAAPIDTIIINDGKFSYKGKADSVMLCMIYAKSQPFLSVIYFAEPGKIALSLSQDPGKSTVSGTPSNDGWQELNDHTAKFYNQLMELTAPLYSDDITEERRKEIADSVSLINRQMMKDVVDICEKNINNELGYFLLVNYESEDEFFTVDKRRELIAKLPADKRNSPQIKEVEELLKSFEASKTGQALPSFTLPDDKDNAISLSDEIAKNKLTILDFWASWCGPCRHEMPNMKELVAEFGDKGLAIIGISLDDDKDAWLQAISELGLTWLQTNDTGSANPSPQKYFHVNAIPFTVVVDSKGTILEKGLRGEQLKVFVESHLQ